MFCTSCGKKIDKDDLFCINCGEKNIELQEEYTKEKETTEIEKQVSKAQNELGKVKTKTELRRDKSKLSNIINEAQVKKLMY